jgi:hypothetical protein
MMKQSTDMAEARLLARHFPLVVLALVIGGAALLALSGNVHARLIGALLDGIAIGLMAGRIL